MRTLLNEKFAPITSKVGFLEVSLDDAANALEKWRRRLDGDVTVVRLSEGFPEALYRLEPLTGGSRSGELLVSAGRWTAYFDNSLRGTDAVSAIGYLSQVIKCRGLATTAIPHTYGLNSDGKGRMGSVQFELFGSEPTEFLNYLRTVAVAFDGHTWVFHTFGPELPFEEVASYRQRRVRDRFTSEMLERYCQALGLEIFDPTAYGPDAVLFESQAPRAPERVIMGLAEVQQWLGIRPGEAVALEG